MDVSRLFSVTKLALMHWREVEVEQSLTALITALTQSSTSPSPSTEEAFSTALADFGGRLKTAAINAAPDTFKKALKNTGLAEYIGESLAQKLADIAVEHAITKAIAIKRYQDLSRQLNETRAMVENLNSALDKLHFRTYELDPHDCEIAISIPVTQKNQSLEGFHDEVRGFNKNIGFIMELAGSTRTDVRVGAVSTGSYEFFLLVSLTAGGVVYKVVDKALDLYKKVVEIRTMHSNLEKMDLEKSKARLEIVEKFQQLEREAIDAGIDTLCKELIDDGKLVKKDRKPELKTALKHTIQFLLHKVDNGVDIEVRVAEVPIQAPQENQPEPDEAEQLMEETRKQIGSGSASSARLGARETPRLQLPPPAEEEGEGDKSKK